MKIGIDISQIVYGTGVSFYTQNLVEHLLKIDKKNEYVLFGGSLRQQEKLRDFGAKVFPFPPSLADFIWNRLHILPVEKFIGSIDIFHSSDWTQPPSKAAKVTTIHDFGFLKYPETAHPKIAAVHKRRLAWIKKECDLIIAVSQSTKRDIIEILGIPEEKIRVVYEATPTDINRIEDQKVIDKVKKKFGVKGDYLLTVATLEPRKNLKRIIEAFRLFSNGSNVHRINSNRLEKNSGNSRMTLVIVGKAGWDEEINKLAKKQSSNIIFTGYVNREVELSAFYSGAACFVYPSLYEGFGLPILEAMKCGCPVVTSNVSSMPEVAGEAGILVNPLDVKDIVRGIEMVIRDKAIGERLRKKGFEQVKKFSWEKTAKETLRVYHEVIEK